MEKISIIVPVYNVEKYLRECLNSLVNQTYKNLEIIIVNDGTKDNSEKIIDEFVKKYKNIKYYKKENGGLASARNYGIKKATGNYIGFVDSDDYVSNDMFEFLYKNISENNSDIAICGHFVFNENGIIDAVRDEGTKTIYDNISATALILEDKKINSFACDKLFKKELFNDFEFMDLSYHEDYASMFKLIFASKKVVVCNTAKYYYRRNLSSISFNLTPKKLYDDFLANLERFNFSKENLKNLEKITLATTVERSIALLNVYSRNDIVNENLDKIKKIRKFLKKYILKIILNKNIKIKDKLYSIISILNNKIYIFVAKLNIYKKR